jgi:plasmid stability protein
MAILHVRNVPDDLYESIRRQAQAQNRSISAQVIVLLQRAVAGSDRTQDEVLSAIRRRRFFRPLEAGAPDSTTLLRENRARYSRPC